MESVLQDRKLLIITFLICFKKKLDGWTSFREAEKSLGLQDFKILRGKNPQNLELEYSI